MAAQEKNLFLSMATLKRCLCNPRVHGVWLRDYLPGLADHEAMLWGLAVPTPFPIIIEVDVEEYPRKAAVFAKSAWEKMETKSKKSDLPIYLQEIKK